MNGDPRVRHARDLLAEHQPAAMNRDELRQLLARYQKAATVLLEVAGDYEAEDSRRDAGTHVLADGGAYLAAVDAETVLTALRAAVPAIPGITPEVAERAAALARLLDGGEQP